MLVEVAFESWTLIIHSFFPKHFGRDTWSTALVEQACSLTRCLPDYCSNQFTSWNRCKVKASLLKIWIKLISKTLLILKKTKQKQKQERPHKKKTKMSNAIKRHFNKLGCNDMKKPNKALMVIRFVTSKYCASWKAVLFCIYSISQLTLPIVHSLANKLFKLLIFFLFMLYCINLCSCFFCCNCWVLIHIIKTKAVKIKDNGPLVLKCSLFDLLCLDFCPLLFIHIFLFLN